MTPDRDPDEDPGALGLIALGLALAGGIVLSAGAAWYWPAGCFAAAVAALVAWVRS